MNPVSRARQCRLAAAIVSLLGSAIGSAATITVTTAGDAGTASTCTLRQALASANADAAGVSACTAGSGADTIGFAPNLANSTISLSGGELAIRDAVTVQGSGQTLDGSGASPVLYAAPAAGSGSTPQVALSNLTLSNGYSTSTLRAGGLTARYVDLTLNQVTVSSNAAKNAPSGGVLLASVASSFDHVTISANFSQSSGSTTGGILIGGAASTTLTHSSISGNQAAVSSTYSSGGMYIAGGASVAVLDSTIANNSATGSISKLAGAVMLFDGSADFVNATIANNSASGINNLAGALFSSGSGTSQAVHLVNCTVTGNVANGNDTPTAGGVLASLLSATFMLSNTIASGNSGYSKDAYALNYAYLGAQSSLLGSALQPSLSGNGNVFSDAPGVSALAGNGGNTLTMALNAASPALRAGSTALAAFNGQPLHFDQRGSGFPRRLGPSIDIGAYQDPGDRVFAEAFETEL